MGSELYFFIITGFVLVNLFFGFIIYFVLLYRKKQKLNLVEKNNMLLEFEKTRLESQVEIQENTLKNISMEIHDNIGQVLSLAKLNLAKMNMASETSSAIVQTTKDLVGKAIQDLRDLSKSLNTEYVQQMGLEKAIEYELSMIQKLGEFDVKFASNGNGKYDKKTEIVIFRIVQELLTNIVKHSAARLIEVEMNNNEEGFKLTVSDNGKGFTRAENKMTGIGLQNMYDRAKIIKANFFLESTVGVGTTATLTMTHSKHTL